MAWNIRTWLFGETITAAKLNEIRDALLVCGPGKVSNAGEIPVGTGANKLAGLTAPTASLLSLISNLNQSEKMEWGSPIRGAAVSRSADQTPSGSSMYMEFTTEGLDTDDFVDLSSNSDRITIPIGFGGVYLVGGYVSFEDDDSDSNAFDRHLNIALSQGSGSSAPVTLSSASATWEAMHGFTYDNEHDQMTISGLYILYEGNYLRHYSWATDTAIVNRQGSMWALRLMAIPS
jgi:hypothetical protein